ncbi:MULTISPECIES: metalloregulator ArsR/SmtB family transcription factor [unclassified Brenneria]|uniref:ArsR/SmtB family transcription factor n=1 Tax=unclassified Brenneria TaxID=2634434 RepID=UPI0029C3ED26|nr:MULTISPECIES: metalloregulator ArsR/SmtB family transcription factor [unclassified Brenneria]MDX5630387.1 metalloregulator ArsR/SmtB family transcription factor [Brenneria sp. L3-3Z]MDX5697532.1 metalloregulator ArsR/SmtB family transcription factor [Brenneria sp. L4-2C]
MLKHIESAENSDALERSMAAVAAAISDPSRVKMLCALMDGRAWTATELSAVADIASSTASAHLGRLVSGNLISCLSQGRYRYYRLAGKDIADLIEKIMGVSWRSESEAKASTPPSLRKARTCYDHLAGEIAVKIYDFMIAESWLTADGSSVTPTGQKQFQQLGMTLNPKTRRKACCACLDWSERRFHLGGDAGAVFLIHCEQKGWLARVPGFREVNFTVSGKLACKKWFGVIV